MSAEAVKFLRALGTPRVLVAIHPDTNGIAVGVFNTSAKTAAWIERWNATRNCYFTVNRVKRPMTKKPEKSDMAWMDYAHAELDPPKAVPATRKWRERVRNKLTSLPYPPTFTWDSGNGTQALWRLKAPVRLLDAETVAACEAVNQGLLDLFNSEAVVAKGVANIDRLLRIPGTTNFPNAAKRQAGRRIGTAGNVECHPERVYDLGDLPTAEPAVEIGDITLSIGAPVFVDDLSDLQTAGWVKHLIEYCNDDGKYPSRSEAEFAAICQMIRDRIPDETILGILTDTRWRLSERVLERGERAQSYATREIANAHKTVTAERRAEFGPEPRPLVELFSEMFDGIPD